MSSVSALNSLLTSAAPSTAVDLSSLLAAVAGASTPGINVSSAVAAGIYAARGTERAWQAQQTDLASQTTDLNTIQSTITSLDNDMQSLNSLVGPLSARAVASSNPSILSGSAVSATAVGNHVVVVNNLASTASWYSNPVANSTTLLPAGSFTITPPGGTSGTITIASNTSTLSDLATQISNGGFGVTASVVTDTSGSRLAIVSNASGTASNFTVSSNSVATASTWSSAPVANATTPLTAGTFTLVDGSGTSAISNTITISGSDTLNTLVAGINALNMGITASVATDASGSHLALASSDGTSKLAVSNDPIGFDFTQATTGTDASITVDGIPVSSPTNTVKGAVGGLTLNLLGAAPGFQVNLSIAPDANQVTTAINQFVADYNTAMGDLNTQFTNGASGQGSLASDPTIRNLQSALLQALTYTYAPSSGSTTVSNLQSLGISVGNDGTLSVNSATLNSAVQNNFSDVQNFFQGTALNGFANSLDQQLSNFINPANGAFTVDLQSISSENKDLQNSIDNYETNYISPLQLQLTSEYSQAEILLQQLPRQMQQINTELGYNTSNSSGG
jgi:flagellar hook-associated protein 2